MRCPLLVFLTFLIGVVIAYQGALSALLWARELHGPTDRGEHPA